MTTDTSLTVMVTRRVLPTRRDAFEAALQDITAGSTGFAGHLGVSVLKPGPGAGCSQVESRGDPTCELNPSPINNLEGDSDIRSARGRANLMSSHSSEQVYRILFRFDHQSNLDTWRADPVMQALIAKADALTEGEPLIETFSGLEAWFTLPAGRPPPRGKMALLTWAALYPLASLLLRVLRPVLAPLPFMVGTLVVTGLITGLMTYVIMPRLTRLAAPWLARK